VLREDFAAVFFFTEFFFEDTAERFDFADALLADFDRDDLLAFDDLPRTVLVVAQRTRVRLLRAVRPRTAFEQRTGFGRVQPIRSSARNASGMARTGVGPSITASTAASERSDRTSAMIFPGR